MQELVYEIGGWAADKFNCGSKKELSTIVSLIELMAEKFDKSVNWNEDADGNSISLTHQHVSILSTLNESLDKLPFGEDLVKEFVMFNLDVPFSKHFLPNMLNVWVERLKQLSGQCFPDSEVNDQLIYKAIALVISRLETCHSGTEQINLNFGSFDTEILDKKLEQIHKLRKNSKKVHFHHMNDNNHLNVCQLEVFEKCLNILGNTVANNDITRLLVLYVICPSGYKHVKREIEDYVRPDIMERFLAEQDCMERVSNILCKVSTNVRIYDQTFTCEDLPL